MMDLKEDQRMARVCRQQAAFASTPEVRTALVELAEYYEGKGVAVLIPVEPVEPPPK
ncbi:MAG TPA: hypothetical protein VF750_09240 [Sphingomicrobium sp.]